MCAATACGSSGKSGPSGADFAPLFLDPVDAAAPTPDTLDGLWSGSVSNGPFELDLRLKLTMGMMTFAAECQGPGVLYAGITVPDEVGPTTITALASASDYESQGSFNCSATMMAQQSFSYQLSGYMMTLTFPDMSSNPMPGYMTFNTVTMTKLSD